MPNRPLRRTAGILLALATLACALPRAAPAAERYHDRWVYVQQNLLVDANVEQLIALIDSAAKAGYNGLVLADYKLNILEHMPDRYFRNVARVRQAAQSKGIEIIPTVFPIGYSDGLLAHDPNLAEGLPVVSAPFLVKRGVAVLDAGPAPLQNGGLEETRGDRFARFSFQDDPGKATFADRQVKHGGQVSCRIEDPGKNSASHNGRITQHVTVRPHTCYRFSCWVKTRALAGADFRLLALGEGKPARQLTFYEGKLEPTQDWKPVSVVFNSLDQDKITIYAGPWGGGTGTVWVDDLRLEALGLVNVLRRPGCPLKVTSDDGRSVFEEKRDFLPVQDPKLGAVPYAGEFDFDHKGATLRLTSRSRITEGQRLRISWYHPVLVHGSQVMCCLSEPKVYDLLRDQARRVEQLLHPATIFMSHDEIRVANWCAACQARKQTPGQLLAENVRQCVAILKQASPKARIVVWSDMFDPQHNAKDRYYLVNGTLEGSWEGLPAEVVIANWNGGKARESLAWFTGRGHKQVIAGYYDDGIDNFHRWDRAARGISGVTGFMYTTWQHKFGDLEIYGKALQEAK